MVVKIPMTSEGLKAVKALSKEGIKTNVTLIFTPAQALLAASIRNPMHVVESAAAGAHTGTVPFSVIKAMLSHPLTESGIERFMKDWTSAFNNK